MSARHEAEPAPPTRVIYRDPDGGFAEDPPAGKLDGWEGRHVLDDVWDEYRSSSTTLSMAKRRAEEVAKRHDSARESLLAEWEKSR